MNPFWDSPDQCARVADAIFPYTGDVESMQGRYFHKIPVVVDDIELWVLTIKQIREARQVQVGRTIDKPEGYLVNELVWNEHFGGEGE